MKSLPILLALAAFGAAAATTPADQAPQAPQPTAAASAAAGDCVRQVPTTVVVNGKPVQTHRTARGDCPKVPPARHLWD